MRRRRDHISLMSKHDEDRARMVATQIAARGVRDARVLDAMRAVPREAFVDPQRTDEAYTDMPLAIGHGQTISQPYIVAAMAEAAAIRPGDTVLEVGAGSGYAAAVVSRLAARVHAIERIPELAQAAAAHLQALGIGNVEVRVGDGTLGWPEAAPFDAIIVSAGGPEAPPALLAQLAIGGRLVIPVGSGPHRQNLLRITRTTPDRTETDDLGPVSFVPLIGAQGWPSP
jgi:protein-L-isoaspartate(D-aspartate) O-methyltransferase